MRYFALSIPLFILLLTSCISERQELPNEAIGMVPIYAQEDWRDISIDSPQSIQQLGKFYYKSPYLYANERSRGIHIFDNSNPEDPQKIAFLKIIGNSDIAIKGNVLYANNVSDLVAIDISNINY